MVFYFPKRLESSHVGSRVVAVTCERCGTEYYYELARIGAGGATAPYGVAASAAARPAARQSLHDLQRRLTSEAELVPCPHCHWINDDLVQGYRRGRYRRWGKLAAGIAFFGTIGSLVGAWFISIGPAADRGALPYVLLGGPAVAAALAVVLISVRSRLRSRIRPNENFPLAPRVPPGSPTALIFDESAGQLRSVERTDPRFSPAEEWIEFQIGRQQFPPVCCVCLEPATAGHDYRRIVAPALALEVPRCAACAKRSNRSSRRIWCGVFAAAVLTGASVLLAIRTEPVFFWILLGTWTLIAAAVAAFTASAMTSPVAVKFADRSRGVLRLRFRNPQYGYRVTARPAGQG
jgi:hypothetical protein